MTDSWTIIEQSVTGEIQYIIATYDQDIVAGTGATISFDVTGYTSGTVAGAGEGVTSELLIEGSNDGISWFSLNLLTPFSATLPLINFVVWGRSVKEIRLTASTDNIKDVYLMAIAGGSGILDPFAGTSHINAPGSNKEIIFNDSGPFAGTTGALYDKAANSNTGQVQLAAGSEEEPMLAFTRGTFPNGTFNSGVYRPENNIVAFSVNDTDMVAITNSSGSSLTPGLNVDSPDVVGAPGHAIKRLGGLTDDSPAWEDGFFGDSEKMIFTASDFSCVNQSTVRPTTNSVPILSAIGNRAARHWPVLIVGAGGGGSSGVRLVATKVIPQGFKVPQEGTIDVYTCNSNILTPGLGGVITCTLEAYFGNIDLASTENPINLISISPISTVTLANWTAGVCSDYLLSAGIGGTVEAPQQPQGNVVGGSITEPQGRRTIMIVITVTDSTVSLDFANGLAGVSVPIQRMP